MVVAKLDISSQIVQRLQKKIRKRSSRRKRHTFHGRTKKANHPMKMRMPTFVSCLKEM
ncbi:hypothetical protein PIB30_115427, partial [Stylosanthes scabra]|nr:hypothetical protein [Stylosanthes scabra]